MKVRFSIPGARPLTALMADTVRAAFPLLAVSAALVALTAKAASAHLEPGSLSSPEAGRAYPAASRIDITWVQQEFHSGRYGIYYSLDGGGTWELIASWAGPSGDDVAVTYAWTVPDTASAEARVRVCQIGNCREDEYVLVSGIFAIGTGSPVRRKAPGSGASLNYLQYLPDTRNLEVSFSLDRAGTAALTAFDARGRRTASLLEGRHAAGAHRYSLSSPRLAAGAAWFRLAVDGRTLALVQSRVGGP